MDNDTSVKEFILLGFPELHGLKMPFFTILLLMYLLSLTGHSMIIIVVLREPMLHTPMYFFLSNFSMAEICSTTAEIPKILHNLLSGKNTICFACCMAQGFIVFSTTAVELITLTVMSFDRYVAIYKPLFYTTIMTNELCLRLALLAWIGGFIIIFSQSAVIWSYPYCGPNVIDHFFCDVGPVLKLACADTTLMELIGLLYGAAIMWGSFGFSLISYACIIATIIRIPSATGRSKAFLTCASHLTVVSLFYLILMIMYLRPSTHGDTRVNKVITLVHVSFIPMLNPFIYTIRNKDFKAAAWKMLRRMF
ncbi:olfactory receptor 6X1-like [Eublepharis macularius]|uniref:Olfactory receptor n=1 Tax=Eublepharis macularius TaxID=481883 RepID=A0AA97K623_EUBMA|nr:olfactory receptor 6X1-like [Eublepharis macularius]